MTMLVDTDVLIWYLRGYPGARERLDSLPAMRISAISWMELLQGFRNRTEMQKVKQSMATRLAQRLPVTSPITERAVGLLENLVLSHGIQLADALIAATALIHRLPLLTANVKHFAAVPCPSLETFRP